MVGMLCSGAFADLLANGSFESGTDDWSSWNEGSIINPSDWGWAQEGDAMVGMWWDAGLYQEFDVTPGTGYDVGVYAYDPGDDPISGGVVARVELDWYNSSAQKIATGWSADFNAGATQNQWTQLSTENCVAPGAASYARLNLAIYNDGTGGGRVYYDNATATVAVPEPGVMASLVFGVGVLLVTARRKFQRR